MTGVGPKHCSPALATTTRRWQCEDKRCTLMTSKIIEMYHKSVHRGDQGRTSSVGWS